MASNNGFFKHNVALMYSDMSEEVDKKSDKEEGVGAKVGEFFKKNLNKGEAALKHAIGLGSQPNAVPVSEPVIDGAPRPVEVGWHPVGGLAGKWFAEQTGLGKMITEKIHKYPDPTQHWAVLVGDFAHQLWMDEKFDVIYTNERIKREEWHKFSVGETKFNDDAVRRAGESVIQSVREKQPAYNLITNNCQTFALQLLDAIKVGSKKEFGTTLAVYERLLGPGRVKDLFVDNQQADGQFHLDESGPKNTVSFAHQIMHDNTAQIDAEQQRLETGCDKEGERSDKESAPRGHVEVEQTAKGVYERNSSIRKKTRRFLARVLK